MCCIICFLCLSECRAPGHLNYIRVEHHHLHIRQHPNCAFSPSAFLHKHTFAYPEMNKQNVVAHSFHVLVDCACCASDVCPCLEELYMHLLGLCNQYVCVHLLGVFMYEVSMCAYTHSCPCHCVSQTELLEI